MGNMLGSHRSQRLEKTKRLEETTRSVWPEGQSYLRQLCRRLELDKQQELSSTDERIPLVSLESPEADRASKFIQDCIVFGGEIVDFVRSHQIKLKRPKQIGIIINLIDQIDEKYSYYFKICDGDKKSSEKRTIVVDEMQGIVHRLQAWRDYLQRVTDKESSTRGTQDETSCGGWQGSSAKTLEQLVTQIAQEYDPAQFKDDNEVHNHIYSRYTYPTEKSPLDSDPGISAEAFLKSIESIEPPPNIKPSWQPGEMKFRCFRSKREGHKLPTSRFSLNIQPCHIGYVVKDLLPKVAQLNGYRQIKVMSQLEEATSRVDNIVFYFSELPGSTLKYDLAKILCENYAAYTRPGHPAMMQPSMYQEIPEEGIAYGHQPSNSTEKSFGGIRSEIIVEAIRDLEARNQKIESKTLLSKVKEKFKEYGINPNWPHLRLDSTTQTSIQM